MPCASWTGWVLTYGGVSLFVVAFAVYPLAVALFQAANAPKRLMPAGDILMVAVVALGTFLGSF